MRQGILRTLFLTLFLCGCIQSFAKTKIALIGDSERANQIADLVMTRMNHKFSFLERSEIHKILRERNLSLSGITGKVVFKLRQIVHADILVVIFHRNKAKESECYSVTVFDAKSGIRLSNFHLPVKIESAVDRIVGSFTEAVQMMKTIDKAKFVSITAVHDSGIPCKYYRHKKHLIADLKRRLLESSDVILLERDHLEIINKERQITSQKFKLAAAARILHFEFSPGKSAEIVNLTMRIYTNSGKLQFRIDIKNCFKDLSKTVAKLVANIEVPSTQKNNSAKKEAKRYYSQSVKAKLRGEYALAKRKLSAAIALAPENLTYIKAMISLLSRKIYYCLNDPEVIRPIVERLEECMYWCDKYYLIKGINKPEGAGELIYYHAAKMLSDMRYRFKNADLKLRKRIMKVATELKPKRLKEIYKPVEINNINDLRIVLNYNIMYSCSYTFYENKTKYFTDFSKAQLSGLKLIENFFNKYPQKKTKQISGQSPMLWVDRLPYPYLWDNACADYFRKSGRLINAYKQSSVTSLKLHGYKLELCRKLLQCDFSLRDSRKYVIDYCRNIEQFRAVGFSKYAFAIPDKNYFPDKYRKKHALIKKEIWKLINERKKIKPKSISLKSSLLFRFSDEQLKETGEKDVRKLKTAILHGNKIYLVYQRYGYSDSSNSHTEGRRSKKQLKSIINIAEYDIKSAKPRELKELYYYLPPKHGKPPSVSVENGYMALETGYRIIYFNLYNNSPVNIIDQLPLTEIMAISIFNGRVYAFLGHKGSGSRISGTILFSCLPDGTERKYHISTIRLDKQHPLDKQYAFNVSGMFSDKKNNRLIFNSNSFRDEIRGLWSFYPESGKCRRLIKAVSKNPLFKINNMVYYLNDCTERFSTYDLKLNKEKYICKSVPDFDKNLTAGHRWGSYFLNGKYFWTCLGDILFCWRKDNLKCVASITLSGQGNQAWIFPHADGRSAMALKGCSIYKLIPVEVKGK